MESSSQRDVHRQSGAVVDRRLLRLVKRQLQLRQQHTSSLSVKSTGKVFSLATPAVKRHYLNRKFSIEVASPNYLPSCKGMPDKTLIFIEMKTFPNNLAFPSQTSKLPIDSIHKEI